MGVGVLTKTGEVAVPVCATAIVQLRNAVQRMAMFSSHAPIAQDSHYTAFKFRNPSFDAARLRAIAVTSDP
jgi:hypothetical protein